MNVFEDLGKTLIWSLNACTSMMFVTVDSRGCSPNYTIIATYCVLYSVSFFTLKKHCARCTGPIDKELTTLYSLWRESQTRCLRAEDGRQVLLHEQITFSQFLPFSFFIKTNFLNSCGLIFLEFVILWFSYSHDSTLKDLRHNFCDITLKQGSFCFYSH